MFKLVWSHGLHQSDEQRIVSVEFGNISTEVQSNKQVLPLFGGFCWENSFVSAPGFSIARMCKTFKTSRQTKTVQEMLEFFAMLFLFFPLARAE
jgi:hypothetical protein